MLADQHCEHTSEHVPVVWPLRAWGYLNIVVVPFSKMIDQKLVNYLDALQI
jgi:hypothetical protein